MSPTLRKYSPHLSVLASAKPTQCRALLKTADPGLVKCLCECALNVLKGNVPLSSTHKNKLKHHKKDLRILAARGKPISKKKRILQKGGLLPALLAPLFGTILPALGGAIGNLLIGGIRRRR